VKNRDMDVGETRVARQKNRSASTSSYTESDLEVRLHHYKQ